MDGPGRIISDLREVSGRRILSALAAGECDPARLAALGDERLKCTSEQLQAAVTGSLRPIHHQLLDLYLEQFASLGRHLEALTILAAETMRPHPEAIARLAEMPGIRVIAAPPIVAAVGPGAATFPTPGQFSSWVGACPGREESAGENRSGRCPKGNRYLRRVLCQAGSAMPKRSGPSCVTGRS